MRTLSSWIAAGSVIIGSAAAQTTTPSPLTPGPLKGLASSPLDGCWCGNSDDLSERGGPPMWPNGVVYFEFDSNVTSLNRDRTYEAMEELMSIGAAIAFVPRTPGVNDANYTTIIDSDENSSQVGMRFAGQELRMFNWGFKFIIVHEFLHALGFYHEQSRWDRDTFITINTANIEAGKAHNFAIRGLGDWIATATPYDFGSVMHYGQCTFTNCSPCCPTITVNPPNQGMQNSIGQRSELSPLDAQDVRDAYGTGLRPHYLRPNFLGSIVGTLTEPFRSIQQMNNAARPGSTVYVQGATTYDDGSDVQVIDKHLTITPYQGVVRIE